MAGAGLVHAEYKKSDFKRIIDALETLSAPRLFDLADFAGAELDVIRQKAFRDEKDPVSGTPWAELKKPRGKGAKKPGSTKPILRDYGQLYRSFDWEAFPDGSVIYGSNMIYGRIHLKGGETGRATIPARPYMGIPSGFVRQILDDPKVLEILGLGGTP